MLVILLEEFMSYLTLLGFWLFGAGFIILVISRIISNLILASLKTPRPITRRDRFLVSTLKWLIRLSRFIFIVSVVVFIVSIVLAQRGG